LIFFSRFGGDDLELAVVLEQLPGDVQAQKSGESTTPRIKRKCSGTRSAHLSMMSTPLE
jgi:hypothetical protein